MDSNLKHSNSSSRVSSADVGRLDKINAIPSKSVDNVLIDGLCHEDQLYISALMDEDSSDQESDLNHFPRGQTTWTPVAQSPRIMKRIKKLKPSYAISLSLEDISYIRPSWGLSKGIKTIEVVKQKKVKPVAKEKKEDSPGKDVRSSCYFLLLLIPVVTLLVAPTHIIDGKKKLNEVILNKVRITPSRRIIEIYGPNTDTLDPILRVEFGQGIPNDLSYDQFKCDVYNQGTRLYNKNYTDSKLYRCITSLDWPTRANMRLFAEPKANKSSFCYHIKWQSYDTLRTPLIDCFFIEDEQWFGLGDIRDSIWPFNNLTTQWTPLTLSSSLETDQDQQKKSGHLPDSKLIFGSHVDLSLLATSGIYIGNLKSDFEVSIRITHDPAEKARKICLRAACRDTCGKLWEDSTQFINFMTRNRQMEYSICTGSSLKSLVSERLEISSRNSVSNGHDSNLPDGIGLIDRTIFATSPQFIPLLDGQTLRQYVDQIVKLGLKTSPILLIDSRWETHVGSLKLNTSLFPKAKLLFEILHNKGFKILFTVTPFIDAMIGVKNLNQLLEAGKIHGDSYSRLMELDLLENRTNTKAIRRRSLFRYEEEPVQLKSNAKSKAPLLFKCKESQEGFCGIIDLSKPDNRVWLIDNIKKSNSLSSETSDGVLLGGTFPIESFSNKRYKSGINELVRSLFFGERLYTIPQWSEGFGYIQLAPRPFTWNGLKSVIESLINSGAMGYSLIHPGSVWGDIKIIDDESKLKHGTHIEALDGDFPSEDRSDEELAIRWIQVAVFMPILQFNNLAPIQKHNLQGLIQNLISIRKLHVVTEIKKNLPFTPLIGGSRSFLNSSQQAPLVRPIMAVFAHDNKETMVPEQFMVGNDLIVAPITSFNARHRDIYIPNGFWQDELRQVNIRGGKWLRNYPVELSEVAWFTRSKR